MCQSLWSFWLDVEFCHNKILWGQTITIAERAQAVWSAIGIVGPFFKFTTVKMKGPNKQLTMKISLKMDNIIMLKLTCWTERESERNVTTYRVLF